MALPIQSNSTQEGCNPISSNCVIWQGPDIPCINLCNGDTVSDVVAKLAEKLCTLLDQTTISAYDLSCFNLMKSVLFLLQSQLSTLTLQTYKIE